jgi:predicted nucleotidyltransferase
MTGDEIMHQIREHDDFLVLHGIKRIGLFGSYARGEQREDSDIDLLVEFDEGKKSYDNFMDLCFFLEDILGKRIDLLTPESLSPFIRPFIEKDVRYETIH